MDINNGNDPIEEISIRLKDEIASIKGKMGELRSQIEQTQTMVDREQQRNADLAADLRNIQDNLDSTPRQDISDKYEDALNARFRLATMQGQLEKFEASYDTLEREQSLLTQVYGVLQGGDVLPGDVDGTETVINPGANIIRIVQAQEEEKQRLARQIHDGPAQSLTNFILQAEICQRLFDRNPERAAEELANLKETASITFQKVRDFIFDLRPMMLDDLGVVPTVRRYVNSFKEKNDIEANLEIIGEERRLENHREVMLFRSVQELMGHARDHASATDLNVRLDISGNPVKIVVQDNGRGFDASTLFSENEANQDSRSRDIVTIKEKFELIGGSISVSSSEEEGTVIHLQLPTGD